MVTLQEYLDKKYPTKEKVERITIEPKDNPHFRDIEGGELDLSTYSDLKEVTIREVYLKTHLTKLFFKSNPKLEYLDCGYVSLSDLDISGCSNLKEIKCQFNQLTSVDFLNTLPNPEKLEYLFIYNNKIQSTNIDCFSKFINLRTLKIGANDPWRKYRDGWRNEYNHFYGSFESWKNLTKLASICIEATDVSEGLEYLPMSLAKATSWGTDETVKYNATVRYMSIECSPHENTTAKCVAIQNELRPYNYDLEAWQLAHPELMLISRPELFTNPGSRDKWIDALTKKITQSVQELKETKTDFPDKIKKLARLGNKLAELQKVKENLEKSTQTEIFVANKQTQTDLTGEKIEEMEKVVEQLRQIQLPKKD